MELSPLFNGMNTSVSALTAQRKRMNAISENLANAETTRTASDEPYRRKQTVLSENKTFADQLDQQSAVTDELTRTDPNHLPARTYQDDDGTFSGVQATVQPDPSPFREVYDPSNPDADANGIVKMPNVDVVKEMTELISASRDFEANATAFNATKNMMKKSLEL